MTESEYEPSPWEFVADHVERYLASDGADGYEMEGAPCVILTTTGRRTGKVRRTPLIRVHDGDNYLVVASLGGAPQHPVWYLNLLADPEVTLQDRGVGHELGARTASPQEKAGLCPIAVAVWPDYANYQAKTERDIPLVVLEAR